MYRNYKIKFKHHKILLTLQNEVRHFKHSTSYVNRFYPEIYGPIIQTRVIVVALVREMIAIEGIKRNERRATAVESLANCYILIILLSVE